MPADARGRPPAAWIVQWAGLVPAGSAVLDLAAGGGRHALFFAERGHPVTAVDRDTSRLPDHPRLEPLTADLEDGSPWPLAGRRFGAVVVTNYLHRPLYACIIDAIAADGVLLYETFAVGHEALGRPTNPDFLLRDNELFDVARGRLTIVAFEQGRVDGERPAIVQRLAATGVRRVDRPSLAWSL